MNKISILAFGGNLPSDAGLPNETISRALQLLNTQCVRVIKVSRFYSTLCYPPGAGPDYVNAAAVVTSEYSALEMLDRLHEIEASFGRKRDQRWGMRTLDIDLLDHDGAVLPDQSGYDHWANLPAEEQVRATPDQLILPHPRITDRAFVLVPLGDIAGGWTHPVSGKTVHEMLTALPESELEGVKPL